MDEICATIGALMSDIELTPEVLNLIAERFRALGEPARLQILSTLRQGEQSVSELVEETGLGQANVSKHLQLLFSLGFVQRRRDGIYVLYSLADQEIFDLCDIMCGRIEREHEERAKLLG